MNAYSASNCRINVTQWLRLYLSPQYSQMSSARLCRGGIRQDSPKTMLSQRPLDRQPDTASRSGGSPSSTVDSVNPAKTTFPTGICRNDIGTSAVAAHVVHGDPIRRISCKSSSHTPKCYCICIFRIVGPRPSQTFSFCVSVGLRYVLAYPLASDAKLCRRRSPCTT